MSFKEGKLDELISGRDYHSAIVTTYTLDPHYLSTIFTSLMRSKQIKNLIVLCDISEYHRICSQPESFEVLSNSKVIVLPANTDRLFHPKVILLVGKKAACTIIGSGNLTYSGMGGNDEIWGAFHATNDELSNAEIIKRSWQLISQYSPALTGFGKKLTTDWILNYSQCLKKILENTPVSTNSQHFELLTNEPSESIWESISLRLEGEHVMSVTVISPYFDSQASILKRIKNQYNPSSFNVVYDEHGLLPERLQYLNGIDFYSWQTLESETSTLHAKIFSFKLNSGKTLNVIGSANATPSGLGIKRELNNVEAVVMFESSEERFSNIFGYELSDFESINYKSLPQTEKAISEPETKSRSSVEPYIIYSEINGQNLSICFNKEIDHPLAVVISGNDDQSITERIDNVGDRNILVDLSSINSKNGIKVRKIKVEGQPYWTVVHSAKLLRGGSPDRKFAQFDQALAAIDIGDNDYLLNILTQTLTEEKAQVKQKFSGSSNKHPQEKPDEDLELNKEDFVEKKSRTHELHEVHSDFYLTSLQKLVEKHSSDKIDGNKNVDVNNEALNQDSEEELPVNESIAERPESMVSISKKSDVIEERKAYRKFLRRAMRYFETIDSITSLDKFKEEVVRRRVVSYWLLILQIALTRIREELVEKIENDESIDLTISPKNRGGSLSLEILNAIMIPKVVGYLRKHKVNSDEILDEEQKLDSVTTLVVLLSLQHYGLKQKNVLTKRIQSVLKLFDLDENEIKLIKNKFIKFGNDLFPNDKSLQNDWRYQMNYSDNMEQIKNVLD